ncbi:hypothetical protein BKA61DRAFT_566170 [Leptodontidium sp. MPI-SDFR-AT-0119]|nr:hypothetical protein BKA61DRAFT_566170 [Leptodontidium sp. MPI-SDFR-AT-0119]
MDSRLKLGRFPMKSPIASSWGWIWIFIDEFDARDNLFIVYYTGHSTINGNCQSVWNYTRDPKSASVDWSSIQNLFENLSSDTLCLLDCCTAGSSANNVGSGTLETIGACGFNGTAPPPGKYSSTTTLVEVLDDWKAEPYFSTSLLRSEVLCQLKRKRPEKGRDGVRMEWCTTPAYFIASSDPRPRSVELCRLIEHDLKIPECSQACPSSNTSLQIAEVSPQSKISHELTSTYPNGDLTQPHVLLSVAFEEDQADLNLD